MRKSYHELDDEDLARICHEAHLALRIGLNSSADDMHFDALPQERKDLVIEEVRRIREGQSPETVHAAWVNWMLERGWRLPLCTEPPLRDTVRKIHPNLVPYADLPAEEKAKVRQAFRIVLTHVLPEPLEEISYWDSRSRAGGEPYDTEAVVCVTHMRFVPCRRENEKCDCSGDPADIDRVYRYQNE